MSDESETDLFVYGGHLFHGFRRYEQRDGGIEKLDQITDCEYCRENVYAVFNMPDWQVDAPENKICAVYVESYVCVPERLPERLLSEIIAGQHVYECENEKKEKDFGEVGFIFGRRG